MTLAVPAETDALCEGCGYLLNGLPTAGRCPECGRPIAQSIGAHRRPASFETACAIAGAAPIRRLLDLSKPFVRTTFSILFRPARFYRTLATRYVSGRALWFARLQWALAAAFFSLAVCGHICVTGSLLSGMRILINEPSGLWSARLPSVRPRFTLDEPDLFWLLFVPFAVLIYFLLAMITRLAARVTTAWATHAGVRLPLPVVLRGLYFHAACYVPIAFIAAATACGYVTLGNAEWLGLGQPPIPSWHSYACVLGIEAVLGLAYLLFIGRLAMRNMMYAND